MIDPRLFKRYYPDMSRDGTRIFYDWIRDYARPSHHVLNVGAGLTSDDSTRSLRGEVARVVGVDIDREVLTNRDLDEAFIVKDDSFPFNDGAFDLAWADFVFEHVERPGPFFEEIFRVLKPGASLFFRTPNRVHYVSLIGRMTPHGFHRLFANRVRGFSSDAHEPYPTHYRLNSKADIARFAGPSGFQKMELRYVEAEPSYLMFHAIPFLAGVLYERIVNQSEKFAILRTCIFGRLER